MTGDSTPLGAASTGVSRAGASSSASSSCSSAKASRRDCMCCRRADKGGMGVLPGGAGVVDLEVLGFLGVVAAVARSFSTETGAGRLDVLGGMGVCAVFLVPSVPLVLLSSLEARGVDAPLGGGGGGRTGGALLARLLLPVVEAPALEGNSSLRAMGGGDPALGLARGGAAMVLEPGDLGTEGNKSELWRKTLPVGAGGPEEGALGTTDPPVRAAFCCCKRRNSARRRATPSLTAEVVEDSMAAEVPLVPALIAEGGGPT
eukprot:Nitzschia sp. Nitz4//scaffold151_size53849//34646//35542//NITZ4_006726-RA/size53849-snap-gene-0.32-mRNA-1//-1//CDS//3329537153//3675//frame0